MKRDLTALLSALCLVLVSSAVLASDVTNRHEGKHLKTIQFSYSADLTNSKTKEVYTRTTSIRMYMQVDDDSECYPKFVYWWENEGKRNRVGRNVRLTSEFLCMDGQKPLDPESTTP